MNRMEDGDAVTFEVGRGSLPSGIPGDVAERHVPVGLGLPREPEPDRDMPFRRVPKNA